MHIYSKEVIEMQKMKNEIFDFFPVQLDLPTEVLESAEEIRIRLRTSYSYKIFE